MIRRLFNAPRVIVLVATIGISGLALGDHHRVSRARRLRRRRTRSRSTPRGTTSSGVRVTGAQLAVLVVVPDGRRSRSAGSSTARSLGRTVKASAENPDLARVQGINPKLVSTGGVGDRRVPGDALDDPRRGPDGGAAQRPADARPEHPRPRARRRGDRAAWCRSRGRCVAGIVDRRRPVADRLQLPRQARPHRRPPASSRCSSPSRSRAAARGREETQTFSFTPKVREIPEQPPRRLVGEAPQPWSSSALLVAVAIAVPLVITAAVAPPARTRPSRCFAICALLADRAHRMGRPAVARPDGVRRASVRSSPRRSPAASAPTSSSSTSTSARCRSRCRS